MRLTAKTVYAAGALAVAASGAAVGFGYGIVRGADRAAAIEPVLRSWRLGLKVDARRLQRLDGFAEQWIDEASLELSLMQARLLRLDAVAAALGGRAGLDEQEFDFHREPGLGGPETPEPDAVRTTAKDWEATLDDASSRIDDRWRQLHVLKDTLRTRELRAAVLPEGRPVAAAYISSGYGSRIDPFTGRRAAHNGVDFAGRPGTEIVAVAAGIVVFSGSRAGFGNLVEIDHGRGMITRYAHNSRNLVDIGQVVRRGEIIAELGATGRATGPNLHFEVLQDGAAIDPLIFME